MSEKRYSPAETISKLREAEVPLAQGVGVGEVVRRLDVTTVTYYRWRKEYGDTSKAVQLHPVAAQRYAQALATLPDTLNDPNADPVVQEAIKALVGTIVVEGKDQDDRLALTVNGLLSSLLTPPQSTLGVFDGSGGET